MFKWLYDISLTKRAFYGIVSRRKMAKFRAEKGQKGVNISRFSAPHHRLDGGVSQPDGGLGMFFELIVKFALWVSRKIFNWTSFEVIVLILCGVASLTQGCDSGADQATVVAPGKIEVWVAEQPQIDLAQLEEGAGDLEEVQRIVDAIKALDAYEQLALLCMLHVQGDKFPSVVEVPPYLLETSCSERFGHNWRDVLTPSEIVIEAEEPTFTQVDPDYAGCLKHGPAIKAAADNYAVPYWVIFGLAWTDTSCNELYEGPFTTKSFKGLWATKSQIIGVDPMDYNVSIDAVAKTLSYYYKLLGDWRLVYLSWTIGPYEVKRCFSDQGWSNQSSVNEMVQFVMDRPRVCTRKKSSKVRLDMTEHELMIRAVRFVQEKAIPIGKRATERMLSTLE